MSKVFSQTAMHKELINKRSVKMMLQSLRGQWGLEFPSEDRRKGKGNRGWLPKSINPRIINSEQILSKVFYGTPYETCWVSKRTSGPRNQRVAFTEKAAAGTTLQGIQSVQCR